MVEERSSGRPGQPDLRNFTAKLVGHISAQKKRCEMKNKRKQKIIEIEQWEHKRNDTK